ncbi:MAG: cysteine--tRNA ligase, partial [Candidatus Margulisbacteria bacterium]|nr:cysteine--tRNA ligase [Candidatus Margulisiibacteriota bacterium]
MTLFLHNTLSGKKEEFISFDPPQVKMYVCGITPYDETHLGHARAYITFDVIRRYLEHCGYKVTYVQNITDVDDKIIAKAQNPHPLSQNRPPSPSLPVRQAGGRGVGGEGLELCRELAEKYIQSYFEVMDALNVKRADRYPKATEHIGEMISWIGGLIDKGYAYIIDGDVYFEVAQFKDYGKLSKRKLEDLEAGARVGIDERKKNPHDFALWKAAKEGEPSWDSPWGKGRPAWHIECSAMSCKYLGEQFDIHGGGMDLIFPHHENEIAQTEAATGKPWVKYWVHNGFVNINKQKMSKSLGNFFTVKDILAKFDPMVVRFFLLQTHYHSPINYSDQELASSQDAYGRIVKFINHLDFLIEKSAEHAPLVESEDMSEDLQPFKDKFFAAMDDDFNTAGAIAAIFDMVHFCNRTLAEGETDKECLEIMRKEVMGLCVVLGLILNCRLTTNDQRPTNVDAKKIEELIAEREIARSAKDYAKADSIRQQLADLGITIEDTPQG